MLVNGRPGQLGASLNRRNDALTDWLRRSDRPFPANGEGHSTHPNFTKGVIAGLIKTKAHWPVTCTDTGEVVYNYQDYLRTRHWKELKEKVTASRHGQRCSCCHSKENLNLHHKTYERIGKERLKDMVFLCREHHLLVHERDKKCQRSLHKTTNRVIKRQWAKYQSQRDRKRNQAKKLAEAKQQMAS